MLRHVVPLTALATRRWLPALAAVLACAASGIAPCRGEETAERLWTRNLAIDDVRTARAQVVDGSGAACTLLLVLGSHTSGPCVELRSVTDGSVVWRRLPGGGAGDVALARPCDDPGDPNVAWALARGGTLAFLGDDGRALGTVSLPGEARSLAVSGAHVCLATGGEGDAFADSLLCFSCGELRWTRELADSGERFDNGFSRPAFGDVNGDGRSESLVVERMNEFVCRDDRGSELWRVRLGEKSRFRPTGVASSDPVVADVTGDGVPDAIVGCFAGSLVVVDGEEGEEIDRFLFGNESHVERLGSRRLPGFLREALAGTGEPIAQILDLDIDEAAGRELVFGCSDGFAYAVSPRRGATLWRFRPSGDIYDRPVADPTSSRLVLWSESGVHALDARTGEEFARLERPCVFTAAVLGWHEDAVDVAIVTGRPARLEAWRLAARPARGDPSAAERMLDADRADARGSEP